MTNILATLMERRNLSTYNKVAPLLIYQELEDAAFSVPYLSYK